MVLRANLAKGTVFQLAQCKGRNWKCSFWGVQINILKIHQNWQYWFLSLILPAKCDMVTLLEVGFQFVLISAGVLGR